MPYTNYCCRASGNNLNAGTLDGGSTELDINPLVTYINGTWDSVTDIYTAPTGSDLSQMASGRFVSIYNTGISIQSSGTYMVGKIVAVNSGTRQITLSSDARLIFTTKVPTGTGNKNLRLGGSWFGPSGSTSFPFGFVSNSGIADNGDPVRVNMKNDRVYNISAVMGSNASVAYMGYAFNYGDSGFSIIDGGSGGASYNLLMTNNPVVMLRNLIWRNNGNTGTSTVCFLNSAGGNATNCIAISGRGAGFQSNSMTQFENSRVYACNRSNTANIGGFYLLGGGGATRCISHDNITSNSNGFYSNGTNTFTQCIAHRNGNAGFRGSAVSFLIMQNCDSYDNVGDGVAITVASQLSVNIEACNLLKNGGFGINFNGSTSTNIFGQIENCGFGSGLYINSSGTISRSYGVNVSNSIIYPTGQTPWANADTGNFSITNALSKNVSFYDFLPIVGHSGTTSYIDIGAGYPLSASSGSSSIKPPITFLGGFNG